MFGRDAERMMDMWMDLLNQIEQVPSDRHGPSNRRRKDVQVNEENGTITITAELAGLDKDQVDVEVSNRTVTIEANSEERTSNGTETFDFELDPESSQSYYGKWYTRLSNRKERENICKESRD